MKDLIVVTGGTKGIGRAIINRFAAKGFDVITCARSLPDLESMKIAVENAHTGIEVYIFKADLSEKESAMEFIRDVTGLNKHVSVLVNNTGSFIPGQIHNEDEGTLEKMIETNLYSGYHITRGIIKAMMELKEGYVFNICSVAGIAPYLNGASYCISKYAQLGMTKVLREEMKPFGIRVTAVIPGSTLTASWDGTELPESRFIKPEDIADTIYNAWSLSKNTVIEEIVMRPQLGDV